MNDPYLDDPFVANQPENRPFWAAAEQGQLLGKRCSDCAQHHWYPRVVCPFCGSANTDWVALSGQGDPVGVGAWMRPCGAPIHLTPWPMSNWLKGRRC
jgi:hypothetical protein